MTASARLVLGAPVDEEAEPARQLRAAVAAAAAAAAQHSQHLRSARLGRHAGILNRAAPKDEGGERDEEEEESSETTTASAPTPTDDLSDHEGTATSSSKTLSLRRLQSKLGAEACDEADDNSPTTSLTLPPYLPSCGGDGLLMPNSVLYYWPKASYGPPGVHAPAAPVPFHQAFPQPNCAMPPAAKALADAWIPLSPSAASAPKPPEPAPVEPAPVQAPPPPAPCRSERPPSLGSQLHAKGRCKPCAFFHTKGCESGLNCQFCHLCDEGEKKRRRKEKLLNSGKPPRSRAKNFARAQ